MIGTDITSSIAQSFYNQCKIARVAIIIWKQARKYSKHLFFQLPNTLFPWEQNIFCQPTQKTFNVKVTTSEGLCSLLVEVCALWGLCPCFFAWHVYHGLCNLASAKESSMLDTCWLIAIYRKAGEAWGLSCKLIPNLRWLRVGRVQGKVICG